MGYVDSVTRHLAGSGPIVYDYTSSMIACLTVTLILLVEVGRHALDHYVYGKPLSEEIVESCYRELTTLGVVEFMVFLVHEIYPEFPLDVERQFATAHFALFCTAIIYSINVFVIAYISFNISSRWKAAENMELDHYVEVRHAFEQLKKELAIESSAPSFNTTVKLALTHPIKFRRYNLLLQQIRFHKLRAHFVRSNNLPKDFPMADYLNSCQRNVLISLVELRQGTWLALLCVLILFFYFSTLEAAINFSPTGTLNRRLASAGPAPKTYFNITAFVFFEGFCLIVLALGVLIKQKMDSIFRAMMHNDALIEPVNSSSTPFEKGDTVQVDLFWRRSPKLIIILYQYMCFVYSVLAGILAMYGPDLDVTVPAVTWAGTAILSLILASYFMPKYTLCVSVGQLVDRATLNESLSTYRLKKLQENHKKMKARRRPKQKKARPKHSKEASDNSANTFFSAGMKSLSKRITSVTTKMTKPKPSATPEPPTPEPADISAMSPELTPMTSAHVDNLIFNFSKKNEEATVEEQPRIASLNAPRVQFTPHIATIDTSAKASYRTTSIPPTPYQYHETPFRPSRDTHHTSASIRWLDIANFADMETEDLPIPPPSTAEGRPRQRPRRKKSFSDTAKILLMSAVKPKNEDDPANIVASPTQSTRRSRRRSISDGVASMRSPSSVASSSSPPPAPKLQLSASGSASPPMLSPSASFRQNQHKRLASVCELNPQSFKELTSPANHVDPVESPATTNSTSPVGDYIPISTNKKKSDPTSFPVPSPDQQQEQAARLQQRSNPTIVIDIPAPASDDPKDSAENATSPVSEWAFSPTSTIESVSSHVRIFECCASFSKSVAKMFNFYWRNMSHVITFATAFTLAARANYLVQFQYPSEPYAINFTAGNEVGLVAVAFWFCFSFLCILVFEGFVQLVMGRWARAVVDLPLTITALVCIIVSEVTCCSAGEFGARYPWKSQAIDYIPVIVIVRLFRIELSERILSFHKHLHADEEGRAATKHAKSLEAQRAFDESRSVKNYGAAAAIQDQHKVGTIVELWYKAVKTHAKIVKDHGAFSGELLRAMLEVAEEKEKQSQVEYQAQDDAVTGGGDVKGGDPNSNNTSRTSNETEGDYDEEYEDDEYADVDPHNDSMEGFHRATNSYETVALPTLPVPLPSNAIFRTASRRMPPLLVDWQEVIFCIDREKHDVAYFDLSTESFLGRIQLSEVARITLSATEVKQRASILAGGGFGSFLQGGSNESNAAAGAAGGNDADAEDAKDLENPTDLISPLSNGAVSLKSSGSLFSRAGRRRVLTTMILLKQGSIMHVKFAGDGKLDGNSITRDFANALCQVTGLVMLDGTMKRQSAHRKRISLKW